MQITFINVGYGDAILFRGSGGFAALLDGEVKEMTIK